MRQVDAPIMVVHDHLSKIRSIPDHLSKRGALNLAQKVKDYWGYRGFEIRVRVEEVLRPEVHFRVRSDMVGGLPRAWRK